MKLHAEIDGEIRDVEIRRDGEKVFASVDGREYELDVSEPELGVFLLKYNGQVFQASTSPEAGSSDEIDITVKGNEFAVRIVDPKRLRSSGGDHAHGEGLAEIKTAMPGKIVRILATAGTEVKKGDGVIVVEAMKMQNEMKSPKDGVVKELKVSETDTVNAGQVLAIIE
jgi:biotin carboxyl carrier protein